ncbi:MAG: Ig-like domain-containing protein [Candidatus Nanopelagicales bacterium]
MAIAAALAGLAPLLGLPAGPASAQTPDVPPPEGGGTTLPVPFVPSPEGFEWALDSRYRTDVWNELNEPPRFDGPPETYDPAYVHPDGWWATLRGCADAEDDAAQRAGAPTRLTYAWDIGGVEVSGRSCEVRHLFPEQATYPVTLTVTDADGAVVGSFEQPVTVRDLLIVSLGDSYGSGESAPDVPQVVGPAGDAVRGADWLDERCHRSANAGSYQAARRLESLDPHTSVTFLSFACSGATLVTAWDASSDFLDPYGPTKPGTSAGTGITGPYLGVEPPAGAQPLASQVDQMVSAVGDRPVDALVVSGGGNDAGFSLIAATCVLAADCEHAYVGDDSSPTSLQARFQADLDNIDRGYDRLSQQLQAATDAHGLDVRGVYLTEYPDSTRRTADGQLCPSMLEDVINTGPLLHALAYAVSGGLLNVLLAGVTEPLMMDGDEVRWAAETVLPSINGRVQRAADKHGWRYVDGIAKAFWGHGYCVTEHGYMRRAEDSTRVQGPIGPLEFAGVNKDTTGTLHPNADGHAMYATRIVSNLWPLLAVDQARPDAPTVTVDTSDFRYGDDGWVLEQPWLTVRATSSTPPGRTYLDNGLGRVAFTIDGADGCAAASSCQGTRQLDPRTYEWHVVLPQGVHTLEFTATDWYGVSASQRFEVRVDTAPAPRPAVEVVAGQRGGTLWYDGPVTVRVDRPAAPDGSAGGLQVMVDGQPRTVAPGDEIVLSGDGDHDVSARAVNPSGRSGPLAYREVRIGRPDLITVGGPDGVYRMNADGTRRRLVTSTLVDPDPTWSPDGNRVAYFDRGYLWTADADGSDPQRHGPAGVAREGLTWSPDGRYLASRWRPRAGESDVPLVAYDLDTGVETTLHPSGMDPDWSPDGSRIAFSYGDAAGQYVATVAPDGADVVRLTDGARTARFPAWSPDGTRIAYVAWDPLDETAPRDLVVMGADGTGPRVVARGALLDHPSWSADGARLAYSTTETDSSALRTVGPDGSDPRVLLRTRGPWFDLDPEYLPPAVPVAPANAGPTALDDAFDAVEDQALDVPAPGVLANDSDPDGDPLTVGLVTGPDRGELTLAPDGGLTYVPAPNDHGDVTFTYRVTDGTNPPTTAEVTVRLASVNDAPTAADDVARSDSGAPVDVDVLANDGDVDGDALTAVILTEPAHGSAAIVDGVLRYTPQPGFAGDDVVSYAADDGELRSSPANVTVTVTAAPPAEPECTVTGTSGNDLLVGTPGRDVVCGLAGDDVLVGLGGDDVLRGGGGNDLLWGGAGADLLDGGAGVDRAVFATSADTLVSVERRILSLPWAARRLLSDR